MLDAFSIFVIGKVDKKEIPEIQKKYDELIEFYEKLYIFTSEELDSFVAENDSALQEQIKSYKAQKEIDEDKIKSMMTELANSMELNEKHKKLNEDYNKIVQKYNVCYNENTENQMKLKNNENLIKDLQKEEEYKEEEKEIEKDEDENSEIEKDWKNKNVKKEKDRKRKNNRDKKQDDDINGDFIIKYI